MFAISRNSLVFLKWRTSHQRIENRASFGGFARGGNPVFIGVEGQKKESLKMTLKN